MKLNRRELILAGGALLVTPPKLFAIQEIIKPIKIGTPVLILDWNLSWEQSISMEDINSERQVARLIKGNKADVFSVRMYANKVVYDMLRTHYLEGKMVVFELDINHGYTQHVWGYIMAANLSFEKADEDIIVDLVMGVKGHEILDRPGINQILV